MINLPKGFRFNEDDSMPVPDSDFRMETPVQAFPIGDALIPKYAAEQDEWRGSVGTECGPGPETYHEALRRLFEEAKGKMHR